MPNTSNNPSDLSDLHAALADDAGKIAAALLGEPSWTSTREHRWGKRGSISLRLSGRRKGLWYDHERGEGGNLLSLIARERNVSFGAAIEIARRDYLDGSKLRPLPRLHTVDDDEASARTESALRLWREAAPLSNTLGGLYFISKRSLPIDQLDLRHVLRWHRGIRAIVGLMTNAESGQPVGVHRTFLDAAGAKVQRKMLGRQGIVRLSPDEDATMSLGITEGIEDGLAVILSGWAPVWAATSAGAIAKFPLLAGIGSLTVFADSDSAGMIAAASCAQRWAAAGREVAIAAPPQAGAQ